MEVSKRRKITIIESESVDDFIGETHDLADVGLLQSSKFQKDMDGLSKRMSILEEMGELPTAINNHHPNCYQRYGKIQDPHRPNAAVPSCSKLKTCDRQL
jgi:hypothetical protein